MGVSADPDQFRVNSLGIDQETFLSRDAVFQPLSARNKFLCDRAWRPVKFRRAAIRAMAKKKIDKLKRESVMNRVGGAGGVAADGGAQAQQQENSPSKNSKNGGADLEEALQDQNVWPKVTPVPVSDDKIAELYNDLAASSAGGQAVLSEGAKAQYRTSKLVSLLGIAGEQEVDEYGVPV